MNPSTAFGRVMVDELLAAGVTEAVLAPGSRSAPLALALAEADRAGRLRLHVRVVERSAGFLAVGLARAGGGVVPVVTTSGTAVANLHPAVLEASHSGLALLVLSADRPPELRGVGANQATDQLGIFGTAVRWFAEVGAPRAEAGQVRYWRSLVARAVAVAGGALSADPGPVQLNCALADPLVADGDEYWPEPLAGRADGPWTKVPARTPQPAVLAPGPGTVVVAGDNAGAAARSVAEGAGWPLFAEPSSRARLGHCSIGLYRLLLATEMADQIERVIVFGHPTLSRAVQALLGRVEVIVVAQTARWPDAARNARVVLASATVEPVAVTGPGGRDERWLDAWRRADRQARAATDAVLGDELTGPGVAAAVAASIGADDMLIVGSSNPIRDLDLAPAVPIRTIANRGLSGIDGTVSTAVGAALVNGGPAYALVGDLAFCHDLNGLLIGPTEARPDLRIVVVNDDGGGIFSLLEQGDPVHPGTFERVFGTPHGSDLAALCAGYGVPHTRVGSLAELADQLVRTVAGVDVVEVPVDRQRHRELHAALASAAAGAVSELAASGPGAR